ncbi:hypothetical protein [Conchiformibius steedae]|uniref:hypothetical protein n=1 Tax=Conchiformibius steedae TaxID=153493 RepID=UPI0026F29CB2|nr:hypothetical protein [Conchiformibius steedae]
MNLLITRRPLRTRPPRRINISLRLPRRAAVSSRYSGKGYIAGTGAGIVTVNSIPARRKIYLYDCASMRCVRSTWSATDGTYRLSHLDHRREYWLVARDYKGEYEPVAYDFVRPKVDSG